MPNPEGINQYTSGGGAHAGSTPHEAHGAARASYEKLMGARVKAEQASKRAADERGANGRVLPSLARAAYDAHKSAASMAEKAGDRVAAEHHSQAATNHSFDIPARRGSEAARQNRGFRSGDFGAAMGRPGSFFKR